ncbi:pilus assembly protein [Geomesophilobacter sediminis]|uniref:Pilus assembly protein PilY n=1 Tax=Geomesophilobacter sediminis TaxID=2798584 RepID=A0A8J7M2W6_9BACT|nr:pilus assembly protein PilY [Geomesophilobacter sediminis]MBJ6727441.1 pilus assembly protein PilY [Geomesophilobacter sediminis]
MRRLGALKKIFHPGVLPGAALVIAILCSESLAAKVYLDFDPSLGTVYYRGLPVSPPSCTVNGSGPYTFSIQANTALGTLITYANGPLPIWLPIWVVSVGTNGSLSVRFSTPPTTTYPVTVTCDPAVGSVNGSATVTEQVSAGGSKKYGFAATDPTYRATGCSVTPSTAFAGFQNHTCLVGPVQSATTVVGTFTKYYSITATVSTPAYGTISPSGPGSYPSTAPAVFALKPNLGYGVKGVRVDNVSVPWTQGTPPTYTFPAPLTSNHTIEVTFAPAYNISASAGTGGSIDPMGTVQVISGQSQKFTITPGGGYVNSGATVDGIPRGAISSYTFANVSDNHWIKADFLKSGPTMHSYCTVPPYVASAKPNVLLLLDNSSSMADLAYADPDPGSYCYDDSFSESATYVGYFDPVQLYRYDISKGAFVAVDAVTGSCGAAATSYLCLNLSGSIAPRTVDNFIARGNFLNWLAMSKLDVEKYVLTGGKWDAATGLLQGESRGCQGKRFVKVIGAVSGITFAVRGPAAAENDYSYGGAGATRIEIYDGALKAACRALGADWLRGGSTQLKTDLDACFNNSTELIHGLSVPSKGSIYDIVIADCYSALATNTAFPLADVPVLENDCYQRYQAIYGSDTSQVSTSRLDDGVCGAAMTHQLSNGNTTGFFGSCYSSNFFDRPCTVREADDYCRGVVTGYVQDPSAALFMSGTQANIPSFFVDAGVASLGPASGTFMVRLPLPALSRGIIQEFSDTMNLGVMVFNHTGSASECSSTGGPIPCATKSCRNQSGEGTHRFCLLDSDCVTGETCLEDPLRDGGRVISYVGEEVGDHSSSGLVSAIDGITATTWTPIAESFYNAIGYFANRTDLRIPQPGTEVAWEATRPPSGSDCQKNHILIVTDGMSTADQNPSMEQLASVYAAPSGGQSGYDAGNSCPAYSGSRSLRVLAWLAKNRNIKTFSTASASGDPPSKNSEFIATHAIFTGTATGAPGDCDPVNLLQNSVDPTGHEKVVNAADPATLYNAFRNVLTQIAAGSKTGTDATVLSSGRGNGSVFLQEFFYPQVSFDNGATSASWIGEMQGLWYYIDSFIGTAGEGSTVRDDAGYSGGIQHTLNLAANHVVQYSYAPGTSADRVLQATLSGGSGPPQTVTPEAVQSLWRAGTKLWQRDAADRRIYTQTDGRTVTDFTALDVTQPAIRGVLQATDEPEARNIISYVRGYDFPQYRNRTIAYPLLGGAAKVWKLGDIVSSTPRVQSTAPLNSYHLAPSRGYADQSYGNLFGGNGFTDLPDYLHRGMVYVGANDGMLHAFQLGMLNSSGSEPTKATLTGADLGREEWAFIPKNALPYLKYLADVQYPHLSFVDGGITLVDAAIGDPAGSCSRSAYWDCPKQTLTTSGNVPASSSWRTVLVGGMGLGGASRPLGDSCKDAIADSGTCVKAPVADAGLSSYFALDVTDQSFDPVSGARSSASPPRLLWELSDPDLGFSTSGAAIVRLAARRADGTPDNSRNGHWYAVFASGPTGPVDGSLCQFKGSSGQNLKIFVVDLNAVPPLVRGTNYWVIDTGIGNAFGGTITGAGIDVDKWNPSATGYYQDDALYLGYTKNNDDGSWGGGVLRVVTGEDPTDPSRWKTSMVIDGIGPVTTAVVKLQDRAHQKLWLFFGTGRYFYGQDDMNSQRAIFGVREDASCYTADNTFSAATCANTISDFTNSLTNKTSDGSYDPNGLPLGSRGWYITLDPADANSGAERVVVDPTSMTNGAVYFTTYQPSTDLCHPEGTSYLWGVRYDSGASLAAPGGTVRVNGKALVRQSSGGMQEIGLGSSFTDKGGRRGGAIEGRPGGLKIVTNAGLKPVKKILHIQER